MPTFTGPLSHRINSTTPLPYTTAHAWLCTYSARSKSRPHMHPDAQFSRTQLSFGTHGASGGITLNQLRKLARGLKGERVTPEPEDGFLPEGDDARVDSHGGVGSGRKRKADMTTESEWEDAGEWAEKQGGNEVGEVDERSNFVAEVEEVPEVVDDVDIDKEERKRLKKEKKALERRDREEKRKRMAKAEAEA